MHTLPETEQRLLSESRLPAADEPPAEEADEAAHHHNGGDGDPRDRTTGEVGPAIASSAIFHEVAEDGTPVARWSRATQAALDARDRSTVRLAGRARASREVVSAGTERRLTALYTSGTAERHVLSSHEQHHTIWK